MALKTDPLSVNENNLLGLNVEDLGDLQIIDDESDSDDNKVCVVDEQTAISNIPSDLVQSTSGPVYGSVAVTQSENVQFGNNTYFNGPVTIKQIIQTKSGVENASYTKTDDESPTDSKNEQLNSNKKFQIQTWHKVILSAMTVVIIGGIFGLVYSTHHINVQVGGTSDSIGASNFETSNTDSSSNRAKVVALHYENFVMILIFITLVPLTFLFTFYSLLTKTNDGESKVSVVKKNKVKIYDCGQNDNYCMQYSKADKLLIAPNHLRIVDRTDWLAQPVEGTLDPIRHPVPWVVITHTATESCHNQSQCVLGVRLIQSFHIESRGWFDIGYNFLVGGDGSAYFGRGWDYIGAHTKGYNKYSVAIAFIGTFNNDSPPKQQVDACIKLIKQGVEMGKIAKNYKLFAHRQLMSTLSPGDKIYDIIKKWPNFVQNVDNLSELLPNY